MRRNRWSSIALALVLTFTGTLHFVIPAYFDRIVPGWLPLSARFWTLISGAAELTVAAAVALPATRDIGGVAAAVLFIAVFPANIKMAIDWADRPAAEFAVALARLPLQIPLVWWGYRVYVGAHRLVRSGDVSVPDGHL